MKIKAKTKDCLLIVKVRTSFSESINHDKLKQFERLELRGFLKPKDIKKSIVEFRGPVGISLHERLQNVISKKDFLFILEQLVVAIQKLNNNDLPIAYLITDLHYIFINEITKEVQFLYFPMESKSNDCFDIDSTLTELIEYIVYSVKPGDKKDEFVSKFIYYFKSLKSLDINQIENYIAHEDRSILNVIKKQNAGQSGFMTDKYMSYYKHCNEQNEDDDSTGLLTEDDDESTGLLSDDIDSYGCEETTLLGSEETGLLVEDEECEGTQLLVEDEELLHYPTMYRLNTDETILIDKPVFRLGKEKSYVDYFVTNNVAVSRSHADIITRKNKYYIVDLNSKNHTFINSQEIPVRSEMELRDGDKIKLGNEEFIFKI